MNQRNRWESAALPTLLALVLPILAACTNSAQAPLSTAATTTAAVATTAPPTAPAATAGAGVAAPAATTNSLGKLNHIVVIYQENWSFDSLYPTFPGANGIANAGDAIHQIDKDGKPYARLPQSVDTNKKPPAADTR